MHLRILREAQMLTYNLKTVQKQQNNYYPASWQIAQLRAFPEPPGKAPIGI